LTDSPELKLNHFKDRASYLNDILIGLHHAAQVNLLGLVKFIYLV